MAVGTKQFTFFYFRKYPLEAPAAINRYGYFRDFVTRYMMEIKDSMVIYATTRASLLDLQRVDRIPKPPPLSAGIHLGTLLHVDFVAFVMATRSGGLIFLISIRHRL